MIRVARNTLSLLIGTVCLVLLVGCVSLPTYNFSDDGDPTETVNAFMAAVIDGDDGADAWVSNYIWQDSEDGETVSGSDLDVLHCIQESRSYEVTGTPVYSDDAHHANVTMEYTCFDVSLFRQELSEKVIEQVQKRQYMGEVFETPDDIADIVEKAKQKLLKNPENYYTTRSFDVELVSSGGRWRIVVSDELYNALTGYAG